MKYSIQTNVDGGLIAPIYSIIGASPQIDKEPRLQELINKTISIGINYSAFKFKTDYLAGLDSPFIEQSIFAGYKLIVDEIETKENELGCYSYTVTAAINYVYKKNKKSSILLIGIDHSLDGNIDRYKGYPTSNEIPYNRQNQINTRNYIERHNTLNIIQTDLNSKGWNLKYMSIEDILNDKSSFNRK